MKERVFFDDEFEKQLKDKTDQFKMYPSDKVWNEVYSSLHTRRRRFVAGMTILIGGILTLAGTQLIFPSKNTLPKAIAIKTMNSSKAAAEAAPPGYSPSDLTTATQNASINVPGLGDLNTKTPFILRSEELSNQKYLVAEKSESGTEKIQTDTHDKSLLSENGKSGEKSVTSLDPLDMNAASLSLIKSPIANPVSDDLIPEKSVTQLTHIRNDRFGWEIYITPTLNSHYLNGINYQTMGQSIRNSPIMVVHIANVNSFVDNTPVLGYAVGGNIIYRISKNISLKAGLEFSYNRYYIKVYNASRTASASLNSYLGYVADSLVNPFSPDISANKNPQHYQNRYYQLSVPVGLDMKVLGSGKFQLHLGVNLQPSYLLNTDAYVLSNDYSRYSQDAQAFRRWNLIAGAEAFISYGVGNIRWELGPQVRYQIFSTYNNSYPLQENMLNYGIRIGISKTIW